MFINTFKKLLLDPDGEMGGDQTGGDDTTSPETKGKTMLDFVKESIGEQAGEVKETKEEDKGNAQILGTTEEKEEKEEVPGEGEVAETEVKEEKEEPKEGEEAVVPVKETKEEVKPPIPYERFEEVNTKYRNLEQEYEQAKPIVESHRQIQDYCAKNNITQQQFGQMMEIQALLNNNPEEALKRILPIVEAVQGFTGEKLPADLQKEVDGGELSLSRAREVASLRAKQQFGASRYDQYQKRVQEEEQTKLQRGMTSAMTEWVSAKEKLDPDFKPRKDETTPSGVYELTTNAFVAAMNQRDQRGNFVNLCKTPEDITRLLQKSYDEVLRAIRPAKKPVTRPILSSTRSGGKASINRPEEASSLSEVVRLAANGKF